MSKYSFLNGSVLKWIAVITMIIDHAGEVLFPEYEILRLIGRISFPIFAFLLAEGYKHTSSVKKYLLRLFIMALVSEVPFDYCLHGTYFFTTHQNIFFELSLGLVTIYLLDREYVIRKHDITIISRILIVIASALAAYFLSFDFRYAGILIIVAMYYIRDYYRLFAPAIFVIYLCVYGLFNALFAIIPLLMIYFYNGKRGRSADVLRWAFYIIYPLHLIIISLFR